jgi:hypothetical protein
MNTSSSSAHMRDPQFFSSTFNKGERVALLTAGGDTIVSGVVEAINLLNTTVRTDLGVPVSIPNKVRLEQLQISHRRIREDMHVPRADGAQSFQRALPSTSRPVDVPKFLWSCRRWPRCW